MPEYEDAGNRLAPLRSSFVTKPPTTTGRYLRLIYHLPSALDPQTPQELRDITELICTGIKAHSLDSLAATWPAAGSLWTYDGAIKRHFSGDEDNTCDLLRGFSDFLLTIWHRYRPIYEQKLADYPLAEYEKRCQDMNVIGKWEKEFQAPYPYSGFTVVICPESSTKAMSIRRDRIIFGAEHSWHMLRQAVVHEIGVRVPGMERLWQHPATRSFAAEDPDGFITLVEAEACYRKRRVFPDIGEDDFLVGMGLQELVGLRAELSEVGSLYELYAQWYTEAKSRGLLH